MQDALQTFPKEQGPLRGGGGGPCNVEFGHPMRSPWIQKKKSQHAEGGRGQLYQGKLVEGKKWGKPRERSKRKATVWGKNPGKISGLGGEKSWSEEKSKGPTTPTKSGEKPCQKPREKTTVGKFTTGVIRAVGDRVLPKNRFKVLTTPTTKKNRVQETEG